MSLTKRLGGNYDYIYLLFLPRESLVSDIPAGDGNIETLFYGVLAGDRLRPHMPAHRGRVEIEAVHLPSQLERTLQLCT
jgi:hypothetical protein